MKQNHAKLIGKEVVYIPQAMFTRKPASKKMQEKKAKFMARFYSANGRIG